MSSKLLPVKTGEIFGRFTAVSDAFSVGRYFYVNLRCVCGNTKKVEQANLRKGASRSCGCLNKEMVAARSITHGKSKTPIYAVWNAMLGRCLNPSNLQYPDYGGRGITLCDRWRLFENFYEDMGDAPFKGASIDRKDNEKGYSKENCRWATRTEQNNNQRTNVRYAFNGKVLTLPEWSTETGIGFATLRSRIYLYEWPIEKALTTPVKKY